MRQGEAKTVISRTGAQRTFRFVSTGSGEIAVCSPQSRIYKQALIRHRANRISGRPTLRVATQAKPAFSNTRVEPTNRPTERESFE